MNNNRKIHIAVVGLGFGAEFVPIYLDHPDVAEVTICDKDAMRLVKIGDKFNIDHRVAELDEVTQNSAIDAVHLITGIPDHCRQSVAVLNAGKHCACTVPMATSLDDVRAVITAQQKSGCNYMMMETAVYTRQFRLAQALNRRNDFGRIQFLRGAHYQDMEHWPPYWAGLPPMWYATHAVSPLLAIADARVTKVHCFGSGEMRHELTDLYSNPWPIETAIYQLDKPNLAAEVTRSLFQCARPYMESFTVYGEKACYEWQMEDEAPMLFRLEPLTPGKWRQTIADRPVPPDAVDNLPEPIRKYSNRFVYSNENRHLSFEQGGGHHGSHPHLVHEFVRSIVEKRPPWIDAITAANWTAAGICAHESAMGNGVEIQVPIFG